MQILYSKKFLTVAALILTILVLIIGHQKRSIAYSTTPDSGILDELSYTWEGMSIRQTGVPVGWSDSGVYHGGDINKRGEVGGIKDFYIQLDGKQVNFANIHQFKTPFYAILDFDISKQTQSRDRMGLSQIDLVAPFFDHPPLGGLIYSLAVTPQTKTFSDVTTFQTRKVSLYLAIITGALLFILAFLITGNPWVGLLATSIYNFAPAYFFASRPAFLENVIAPFALLQLVLLFLSFRYPAKKMWLMGLAGLVAGLTVLVKESGLGFMLGSLIIMRLQKLERKDFYAYLKFFAVPVVLYIVWGMYLSADTFFKIIIFNGSRQFWGALNFLTMFTSLRLKDFPFDGWWVFGFISWMILALNKGKISNTWMIAPLAHLILILFLGGFNYSWYYLALVPFLALGSAIVLWQLLIAPGLVELITFFVFPASSSLYWGHELTQFTPSILEYRLFMLATFGLGSLAILKNNKKLLLAWRIFLIITLIILMAFNYKSLSYIMSHWGKSSYPSLPPT